MGLKSFHVVFIIASILLCAFFGWWAMNSFQATSGLGYLVTALLSFAACAGLIIYSIYFIKKVKGQ